MQVNRACREMRQEFAYRNARIKSDGRRANGDVDEIGRFETGEAP